MDLGLFLVIMILFYVVPELLKRFKKKRPYQYPEFPPTDEQAGARMPGSLSQGAKPPPVPVMAASAEGTAGDEGDPNWRSENPPAVPASSITKELSVCACCTDARTVMQGIVWAEIIAPPVSLRRKNALLRRF